MWCRSHLIHGRSGRGSLISVLLVLLLSSPGGTQELNLPTPEDSRVARLARQLASKEVVERSKAVVALAKLGSKATEAVPHLIAVLSDWDAAVRSNTALALGKIGDPRAVLYLIATLDDQEYVVREAACMALGELGDPRAIEPLTARLGDEDSNVRRDAAEALAKLGGGYTLLIASLEDTDPSARAAGAHGLMRLGGKEAIPFLIPLLRDPNNGTREAAAEALGRLGGDEAFHALLKAVGTSDKSVHFTLVKALGQVEAADKAAHLSSALRSGSTQSRLVILRALGEMRTTEAFEALIAALGASDFKLRKEAVWILGNNNAVVAAAPISRLLSDESLWVRRAAADALGRLSDEATIPALLEALADPDYGDRAPLTRALKNIDPEWRQRSEAREFTSRLSTQDSPADPAIMILLKKPQDPRALLEAIRRGSMESRRDALKIMADLGSELDPNDPGTATIHRIIVEALAHDHWQVKEEAARALVKTGYPDAVELLLAEAVRYPFVIGHRFIEIVGESGDRRALPSLFRILMEKPFFAVGSDINPVILAIQDIDEEWEKSEEAAAMVPEAIKLLSSPTSDIRKNALYFLYMVKDPRAIAPVIDLLSDESDSVRRWANRALVEMKASVSVPALIVQLGDEDPNVRLDAANTLGELGTAKDAVHLAALLDDPYGSVRREVSKSLEKLGWHPASRQQRIQYLIGLRKWTGISAEGEAALKPLIAALGDSPAIGQRGHLEALYKIDENWKTSKVTREKSKEWMAGLDPSDKPAVYARMNGLVAVGEKNAVEPLIKLLVAWDHYIRGAAGGALEQLSTDWRETDAAFRAAEEAVEEVRSGKYWFHALEALKLIRARQVVPHLIEILEDPGHRRQYVLKALQVITGADHGEDPAAWRAWWGSASAAP